MIILDLDNCIADDEWRLPFVLHEERDTNLRWHNYHAMSLYDDPPVLSFLPDDFVSGRIVIFTSRPEQYRDLTRKWLTKFKLSHVTLFMRETDNFEPTVELKMRFADQVLSDVGDITMAYDDRPDVVEAYRAADIPATLQAINRRLHVCSGNT